MLVNPEAAALLLPSVSIAISSVLGDSILRSDLYLDRIRIQVLLWLAASLQKAPRDRGTAVWIHIVFLSSIASIATRAWTVHFRWNVVTEQRPELVRLVPPSVLVAVLYSFASQVGSADGSAVSWQSATTIALGTFLLFGAWRVRKHRRMLAKRELVGMPTVVSSYALNTRSVDESAWPHWSPSDVLQWISSLPDQAAAIDWKSVCRILAPERIPGSVLDTLTLSELRSVGIGIGPARCLVDNIQTLTRRYPARRSQAYDRTHDMLEAEGWLTTEKNDNQHQMPDQTSLFDLGGVPGPPDESVVQRAQGLMQERYGIELPEMKAASSPNGSTGTMMSRDIGNSRDIVPTLDDDRADAASLADPLDGLPPELLESMPPSIREIARRKPDVVAKILEAKKSQAVPTSSSQITTSGEKVRLQSHAYLKTRIGAQERAQLAGISPLVAESKDHVVVGETDVDEDGEQTGLLRKRAGRSKYASIR